jgi:hypothetical protein
MALGPRLIRLRGSMADMKSVAVRADETIGAPPGSR